MFVRDQRSSKRNSLALLSTDIQKEDGEIILLYGKRWQIQTFFQYNKSYLKLNGEFSGHTYDQVIAHTTIVFTRYILFALLFREEKDQRSIGELFYLCCDEVENIRFGQALALILSCLTESLLNDFVLSEQHVQELLDTLFN